MSAIINTLASDFRLFIETQKAGFHAMAEAYKQMGTSLKEKKQSSNVVSFALQVPFFVLFSPLSAYLKAGEKIVIETYPLGRKNDAFQSRLFLYLLMVTALFIGLQPSPNPTAKLSFINEVVFLIALFAIMAMGLNLQTGLTGLVNFGVIFFVGFGALVTAMAMVKGGMDPWIALLLAVILTAIVGYLLAYPTLNLRSDYFAIVTVVLGEVLRQLLLAEPTFQTKVSGSQNTYIPELPGVFGPFRDSWRSVTGLPYSTFLMIFAVFVAFMVVVISQLIIRSPYGRVLKTIRENEVVTSAYGYDVFKYKAEVLAIGGAIFGLAGALLVWKRQTFVPELLLVTTTFFVWGAFIIGGKGNPRGMVIGAIIITYTQQVVRNISPTNRGSNFFIATLDSIFKFLVVDIGGAIFGEDSWRFVSEFQTGNVIIGLEAFQILIVGLVIILFMRRFEEGVLPELPYIPKKKPNLDKSSIWSNIEQTETSHGGTKE